MLFFIFNNSNIQFVEKKLNQRFYTVAKALPTTKWVELMNKEEFVKMTLDENSKIFVMHVVSLKALLVKM